MSVGSAGHSGAHDIYLDAELIRAVAGFYRRLALVTAAAATDLRGHEFGAWTHDGHVDHVDLRDRYRAMAGLLAARLEADATRAGALAEGFGTSVASVAAADLDANSFSGSTDGSAGELT